MEICAVILARGGSKRLPNKNIIKLLGRPLISYTIEAAKRSKYINRVICSTDSKKIADAARKCGAEVPFIRPKELALDNTPSIDSLRHALAYLRKKEGYSPDAFVLLQPTSPLRTHAHIDSAIELFCSEERKSVVSVKMIKGNIRTVIDGELVLLSRFNRKLSSCSYYSANGAIYVASPEMVKRGMNAWMNNAVPYIMDETASVDIDTEADLKLAKINMKSAGRGYSSRTKKRINSDLRGGI